MLSCPVTNDCLAHSPYPKTLKGNFFRGELNQDKEEITFKWTAVEEEEIIRKALEYIGDRGSIIFMPTNEYGTRQGYGLELVDRGRFGVYHIKNEKFDSFTRSLMAGSKHELNRYCEGVPKSNVNPANTEGPFVSLRGTLRARYQDVCVTYQAAHYSNDKVRS